MGKLKKKFLLLLICIPVSIFPQSTNPTENLSSAGFSLNGFCENNGQITDQYGKPASDVLFKAQSNNSDLYVTRQGLSFVFSEEVPECNKEYTEQNKRQQKDKKVNYKYNRFDMRLIGANIRHIITENQLNTSRFDCYTPQHPNGVIDIKTYKKIIVKEIYPGIDWHLYYDEKNNLKYDFIVHPGGDPNQIQIDYTGATSIKLSSNKKSLEIAGHMGLVNEGEVYSYQPDEMKEVETYYHVSENNRVSFDIGIYNKSFDLIIDPPLQLWWSTYFGGIQSDSPEAIATDNQGNIFITGWTYSNLAFPALNPGGPTYFSATGTLFISKFNNSGVLLWSTLFGSSTQDVRGFDIAVDPNGNVFIAGHASFSSASPTMPVISLAGAYNQAVFGGGDFDAILLKFSNAGALLWSTYYGGNGDDQAHGLCTDAAGNIYMTGFTISTNFPLANPGNGAYFQNTFGGVIIFLPGLSLEAGDAFIVKFDVTGNNVWSTYLGGNHYDKGTDISLDASGNIYLTGHTASNNFPLANVGGNYFSQPTYGGGVGFMAFYGDIFITKFSPGYNMLWSTYYGGNADECANSVEVDNSGNIWLSGFTRSPNFPTVNLAGAYNQSLFGSSSGLEDIFIVKFNPAGTNVLWATYYGGSADDVAESMKIDECGNVYLVGGTSSTDFPLSINPGGNYFFDSSFNGQGYGGVQADIQVISFSNNGTLQWATYFGGTNNEWAKDIVIDKKGAAFLVGRTYQPGAPVLNPGNGAYFSGAITLPTPSSIGENDGIIIKLIPDSLFLTSSTSVFSNVSCFGSNNGSAAVNVNGGTPPYRYLWNTTPAQTSAQVSGLSAGSYTVIVHDDNCSIDTLSFSITQPAVFQATITSQNNILCNGSNAGSASVASLGGTLPYTYSWIPGNYNTPAVTQLTAGNYTVDVTDNNGCTTQTTISITEPLSIILNPSYTNPSCNGINNGVISINHSGGILPFSYSWNTGNTSNLMSGLAAGVYTVTITDANGCKSDTTIILTQSSAISYTLNNSPSKCGLNNGYAQVNVSGGSAGYSYSWSNGSTSGSISNLVAGNYSVTISDSNGCSINVIAAIGSKILSTSVSANPINCSDSASGSANAITLSGTAPYTYNWSNSQTTQAINNLIQGTYSLTITDSLGCRQTHTFSLTQPAIPLANAGPDDTICSGETVLLTASGGLSFLWSTGTTQNNLSVSPLSNSTYSLVVTTGSCSDTDQVNITVIQPQLVQASSSSGISQGASVTLSVNGNGSYLWSPSTGLNCATCQNPFAQPGESTIYYVTVTDQYGCTSTDSVLVSVETNCNENIFIPNVFSPNGDGENDQLKIFSHMSLKKVHFVIYNRWGEIVFITNDADNYWDGTHRNSPMDTGVYNYIFSFLCTETNTEITRSGNISLVK